MSKGLAVVLIIILVVLASFGIVFTYILFDQPSISLNRSMPTNEVNYSIVKSGFEGNTSSVQYFNSFKLVLKILEGQLSIINIQTNLVHWSSDGLNKTYSLNQMLTISLRAESGSTLIYSGQDISNYFIKFYLSNGEILQWQNWIITKL